MEKKFPDRRVQRSRQSLHEALMALILEKRYDKITVQDIIDRADVGRSTFYAHFADKEDLLVQGLAMYSDELESHIKAAGVEDEGRDRLFNSLVFFQHAYLHHDLYRAMQEGGGADVILEAGRRHITADIQAHLGEVFRDETGAEVPSPVITNFLAGAMLSVLNWWLDAGRPYPPEEIDAIFQQIAVKGVETLLHPA